MFNLEQAIAEWKKSLRRKQAIQDGDLVELESYLRDKIEDLIARGMSEEDAFKKLDGEFSRAEQLEDDYYRARTAKRGKRPSWEAPRFMPDLIWNYLKTAGRKIRLHKRYAAISIGSLALAMAVGLLTIVWAQYEMSYDLFHKNAGDIYRFLYQTTSLGPEETSTSVPYALPFIIKETYPEVQAASRVNKIRPETRFESPKIIDYKTSIVFVEPDFLAMFDFPLLKGDPRTVLNNPKSVVLTESTAKKFFGEDDPVGKILLVQESKIPFEVTGVLKNIPETSHLDFDLMMPASDYLLWGDTRLRPDDWRIIQSDLYVQLAPGTDVAALENKLTRLVNIRIPEARSGLYLQPLRDIHLRSDRVDSRGLSDRRSGSMSMHQIRIFLFVSLAVLLMGCINYINLATARSLKRAKEIGIRKVNGAGKSDIIRQFLSESVLFAFVAMVVAVLLAALIGLPILRRLSGLSFNLDLLHKGRLLAEFIILALLAGLTAGFYPAIFVSSFSPIKALKETFTSGRRSSVHFRRILVAVQIVCSATLISVISVLVLQIRYVDHKDLGFNRDSILTINNSIETKHFSAFKDELLSNPAVRGVATGILPLLGKNGHNYGSKSLSWEGKAPETQIEMDWLFVDEDYQKTYGLELVQGRFFSKDFPSDRNNFVLCESAVRAMGLKDPVGKLFYAMDKPGQIIGVIKDFHAGTLKAKIRPMYLKYLSGFFGTSIQIDTRNITAAIEHIAAVVKKFDPERPFEFAFLNDRLRRMYNGERLNARIVTIFGVISIIISCLGLFGLISFISEQKTKEIGIRKVLGATVPAIIRFLSKEFAILVGLSVVIAFPIAFWVTSRWLGSFAYRIGLSWWIFAGSGAVVAAITLLTMAWRSRKAAASNPIDALRYE